MAFVPVPDVALAELIYIWEDQIVENTLYFAKDGGWGGSDLSVLADQLLDWWNSNAKSFTNVNAALQEIKITDLSSDTAPTFSLTAGLPIAGDATGDPLPNNCSLTISFRTAGRGRSSRGRNYIVGLSESATSGNVVDPTVIADIKNAYEVINSTVQDLLPAHHVVVSRVHNKVPRTEGLAQEITSYQVVDPFVDSQRRRLPGRGR
jgi:hypothetical protein